MKTLTSQDTKPADDDSSKPFQKVKNTECLYLYKPNGNYYVLAKKNGKRIKQSLETTDLATAKRVLGDVLKDFHGLDSSQGDLTIGQLADRFLTTIANQAKDTVAFKTTIVKRLKEDFTLGKACPVSKVKQSDVKAWLASYDFSYASYNHYLHVVKSMFEIAVNDKAITISPIADFKGQKPVKPVRITPTFEEFNNIIADIRKQKRNAESNESADFLEFMGLVGVGQAEASGIMKQNVNLATSQLTFFRVKTRTPYVVPIFPQAKALILKRVSREDMKPTDYLFPVNMLKSKNGAAGPTRNAKKSLDAACKRLGLPAYTQRALRRMFVTRCIEKGIDVKVIAQWQGHQDGGKLILSTYSHVRNSHAEDMAKLLAA